MLKNASIRLSVFTFLLLSLTKVQAASDETLTRAAFDLGSGKFKMVVADVTGKKVDLKFSKMIDVKLAEDFASSPHGMLSEKIQTEALSALQVLKQDAEKYGAQSFSGITTAIFRKAKNGAEVFERLKNESGVHLQLISQEKEGIIGFNTACVLSPDLNEEDVISWDSGNASFQITAKEDDKYLVYEGPLGSGLTAQAFLEEVRGIPYSKDDPINPVSLSECEALCEVIKQKIDLPLWLEKKLSADKAKVVAIGDSESIFAIASKVAKTNEFSRKDVRQVIEKLAGLGNNELAKFRKSPEKVMCQVVLLYAVMDKFGIENVIFKESAGSTLGLLIDPDLWN